MSIIRPDGPVADLQLNIIRPGDTVKQVKVDEPIPTTIKPEEIIYQPKPKTPLPPMRKDAINIPGEDTNRDFVMKPTMEEMLRILNADNEAKWRARVRALQPLPPAKIYDPDEEEPWPYAVKLAPPVPRPKLKFNLETYTYISNHVKSRQPYQVMPETKTNWAPPTNPPAHIAVKPSSRIIPTPINLFTNQPDSHVVIRP